MHHLLLLHSRLRAVPLLVVLVAVLLRLNALTRHYREQRTRQHSAENHWSIRNTVFVVVHSNSVLISYRKGIDEYTYRSVILDNRTMSE